eukprot:Em0002g993a
MAGPYFPVERARCSDQENEVLWEGYTKEESSWVPETSLTAVAKRSYFNPQPSGRPWKILRDIEPIRVNVTRNARPSLEFLSLEDEILDYDFVEPVITEVEQLVTVPSDAGSISPRAGTANIVRMLKLLISEKSVFSDVKRFPSVDDRRKANFRTDLNATAFHPIQRVFRAMTTGILKMLLPAWHVPELKKWIKIPDGADREDSDDSDGDGENALPALNASELAVTRSIALSIANCRGTTTSVKARMLMAQMSDLTSNYVEGEGGRKVSTAKQLAVALSRKCVKDTTVLLVKPKHDAPFVSTKVPAIQSISNFYAVEYDEKIKQLSFFVI